MNVIGCVWSAPFVDVFGNRLCRKEKILGKS